MDKLHGMIGLSKKAGKLVSNIELVLESIKKKKSKTVYIASDASDNTKKKLYDSCNYYKVKFVDLNIDKNSISQIIGKSSYVSAFSIEDENINKSILKLLNENDCE